MSCRVPDLEDEFDDEQARIPAPPDTYRIPARSPLEGDPASPECAALIRHLHRGPSYADDDRRE